MIKITKEAEKYIADLFAQQSEKNLGLKITIDNPGTAMTKINFDFCIPKDLSSDYKSYNYEGFSAYIAENIQEYLKDSEILMSDNNGGKGLTISAPNAKGKPPAEDAPIKDKIAYTVANEISPQLASHGGFAEVIEVTDDMIVVLNFGGGCQGCSSVKATLKNGVEAQLKAKYPEIKEVRDVTDHSQTENAYYKN